MELRYLVLELRVFVRNRAAENQIADLCSIIVEQSKDTNLRVWRGAQSIQKRILGETSLPFDYAYAEREVSAMLKHLTRF